SHSDEGFIKGVNKVTVQKLQSSSMPTPRHTATSQDQYHHEQSKSATRRGSWVLRQLSRSNISQFWPASCYRTSNVPVKRHIVCGAKAVKFTSAHMPLHVFNAAHDRQSLRPHFSCHLSQQSGTIEIGVHSARSEKFQDEDSGRLKLYQKTTPS
ncbi:hypothetical protein CAPTEDRAFT_216703, partial [Capitella teleta]